MIHFLSLRIKYSKYPRHCCFQLELRKMLLDRMINLLTRGCVVPVVKYIKQCCQKGDTDTSLIRYFVTEVNNFNRTRFECCSQAILNFNFH